MSGVAHRVAIGLEYSYWPRERQNLPCFFMFTTRVAPNRPEAQGFCVVIVNVFPVYSIQLVRSASADFGSAINRATCEGFDMITGGRQGIIG